MLSWNQDVIAGPQRIETGGFARLGSSDQSSACINGGTKIRQNKAKFHPAIPVI
jgi:hypothetical protein